MHIVCATFRKQTRLDFKWHMWQLRVPIHHRLYIILWRHILCYNSIFKLYYNLIFANREYFTNVKYKWTPNLFPKPNPSPKSDRGEKLKVCDSFWVFFFLFFCPTTVHIIPSTSNLAKWQFHFRFEHTHSRIFWLHKLFPMCHLYQIWQSITANNLKTSTKYS